MVTVMRDGKLVPHKRGDGANAECLSRLPRPTFASTEIGELERLVWLAERRLEVLRFALRAEQARETVATMTRECPADCMEG